MRSSGSDRTFSIIVYSVLLFALVITAYPFILVISSSVSDASAVASGKVWLLPIRPTLDAYKAVLKNKDVLRGFFNSIFYTVGCGFFGTASTILAAYPLSRKDLYLRGFFLRFFMVTMFFSGGIVPTYLVVTRLHLTNTPWILIIGGVSAYNIIIARTFFQQNIPDELLEAAQLDGCSDFRFFFQIVLPLSAAIIAVIVLFVAVTRWNSYLDAMIYINEKKLYPLQVVLRDILIMNKQDTSMVSNVNATDLAARVQRGEMLKYALIVVSSVPMLAIYPFVQKFFVKGVMIGAIKG